MDEQTGHGTESGTPAAAPVASKGRRELKKWNAMVGMLDSSPDVLTFSSGTSEHERRWVIFGQAQELFSNTLIRTNMETEPSDSMVAIF